MSLFKQYCRRRRLIENPQPSDDFKFKADKTDFADDYEHVQVELFRAVMNKYQDEAMQFLDGIAQRGDEEIASLLDKLKGGGGKTVSGPENPDQDEMVPSSADRAHSDSME